MTLVKKGVIMVLHLGFSEDSRVYVTWSDMQVLIKSLESYIEYERLVIKATLDKKRRANARENVSVAIKVLGLLKIAVDE